MDGDERGLFLSFTQIIDESDMPDDVSTLIEHGGTAAPRSPTRADIHLKIGESGHGAIVFVFTRSPIPEEAVDDSF